jgi:RNA polymerase sigma-70 factor (ECF subfamily)
MARLRAGDEAAATRVFDRFAQRLIALARSRLDARLRQKVDPEDVLQSVYNSFFQRQARGQLDPKDWESLWSLLTVITVRKCSRWRDHFRTQGRDVAAEVPAGPAGESGVFWEAVAGEPGPEEAAILTETVEQVLHGLDERDRRLVVLCLQGHSQVEVSAELGCTERTVQRVLRRVRRRLQRLREADAAE